MADLAEGVRAIGTERLRSLGFSLKLGAHVDERYFHTGGTVAQRLSDIHGFLDDPEVGMIMPVFGGYNTNQLLGGLDYSRIEGAKTSFCGYSDITALLLAIGKHTSAPIYHGPSFSALCDPNLFDYTLDGMRRVFAGEAVAFTAPPHVADDLWFLKAGFGPRDVRPGPGWRVHREGTSTGPLIGGNLETICALAGTPYFPDVDGHILFVEDATGSSPGLFHRCLTQLAQMGVFARIAGLMVGAMPHRSKLADHALLGAILSDVLDSSREYPVVLDAACSHVDPIMTLPLKRPAMLTTAPEPTLYVNTEPDSVASAYRIGNEQARN